MDFDWALRPGLAQAIVAGWLTGAFVGLICLAILMIGLAREPRWWERFPGLRVSLPIFGIIAANVMMIGWTLVGVALGFIYPLLGTPAFSVAIAAVAFLGAAGYWVFRADAEGAEHGIVWASLIVVTLAFGAGMPVLAEV